jgi:very-short-patch-repair endonuclease
VCHSPLETIARRLFRKSSLPTPVKQYPVTDSGKFLGRVDFAYPDCKIAIEFVGWDFHSGRRRWEKDLRRRTSLESRGWMVLEFTWDEIMNQPDLVIETIHRALTSRSFPDYTRSASA